MADWVTWHDAYDDPTTSLSRRLAVVQACIRTIFDQTQATDTPSRILSLCAGEGCDLLPELTRRPADRHEVTLIEQNPELARRARQQADAIGLQVEVIQGDAGTPGTYSDRLPVDLLLLCGIFGNIPEADITTTVHHLPAMLRTGGHVIWTRGHTDPDLRARIRSWITDAGLTEIAWHAEPETYGVGVARLDTPTPTHQPLPTRLFAFRT